MNLVFKNIFLIAAIITVFASCEKDYTNTELDQQLFNEIRSNEGYLYFQNGDTLAGAVPSPHGFFRLRFNTNAQAVLDSANELPVGSSFPTGSILVKEVIKNGTLDLLIVMKKNPTGPEAASGWQWAEYRTDGSVEYSLAKNGDACISCHSAGTNRDLTRTFDLH